MGARGGPRSWVALLETALMFAPLRSIEEDPGPLTAHARAELVAAGTWRPPSAGATIEPWDVVPANSPYHLARIVGALVDPKGAEASKESVTIFNTTDVPLDLDGWMILDTHD